MIQESGPFTYGDELPVTVFEIERESLDLTAKRHVGGGFLRLAHKNPIRGKYYGQLVHAPEIATAGWYVLQFDSGALWVVETLTDESSAGSMGSPVAVSADAAPPAQHVM